MTVANRFFNLAVLHFQESGFSTAPAEKLYLPIDPSASRPEVATEEKDSASMLNFTRALLKLRRDHPALANAADFQPTYAEKRYVPVYLSSHRRYRTNHSVHKSRCTILLCHTKRNASLSQRRKSVKWAWSIYSLRNKVRGDCVHLCRRMETVPEDVIVWV